MFVRHILPLQFGSQTQIQFVEALEELEAENRVAEQSKNLEKEVPPAFVYTHTHAFNS